MGWARVRRWCAVMVVLGAVAAIVGYGTLTSRGGLGQEVAEAEPPPLAMLPHHPPKRALIYGDSIAAQHGAATVVALEEAGVEARVHALWGESLFTPSQYDMGVTNPEPPAGTLMGAAGDTVAEFDPDVVAVYLNHNYWPPFPRDASGEPITLGSEDFTAMARTQIIELIRRLSSHGARVFLVKPVPETADGDTAADNAIWSAYMSTRAQLGFTVIEAGDAVAGPDGTRVEAMADCRGQESRVRPEDNLHLTYHGAGRMGTVTARALAGAVGVPIGGINAPSQETVAMLPMGSGYRLVTCDGATFRFGVGAGTAGLDVGSNQVSAEEAAAAATAASTGDPVVSSGAVASDGGDDTGEHTGDDGEREDDAAETTIVAGTAYGGLPDGTRPPGDPVVAAADVPGGDGAWLVTGNGRVYGIGGAVSHGDVTVPEGDRAVAIVPTPTGGGYRVATAHGAVLAAGEAEPIDDPAGTRNEAAERPTSDDVVDMVGAPEGDGYWLVTVAGDVLPFGGAPTRGDLGEAVAPARIVAMAPHPDGGGYWLLDETGRVHPFGSAVDFGSAADQSMARLIAFRSTDDVEVERMPASDVQASARALLPTRSGGGYWVLLDNGAVCSFGDASPFGSLHRAEVDEIMTYQGQPYYAEGPCRQDVGFGPPNVGTTG